MAEDASPEGQGGDGGGLYDLSSVPEQYRPHVEPFVKDFQRNTDKKFQEHAQYRDQWSPYEQAGVDQYDPGELSQLLDIFSDEDTFRQAVEEWAGELGLFAEDDDEGYSEEDDGEYEGLTEEQVHAMLQEQLAPFHQQQQEQEQQQRVEAANEFIDSRLDELHEQHDFPEEDDAFICQLALAYDGEDSIDQAFNDYQERMSAAGKNVLSSKLNQPDAPNQGGVPNTAPPQVTDYKQAKELAMQRLQQFQQ